MKRLKLLVLAAALIAGHANASDKKPMTMVGSQPGQLQLGDKMVVNPSTTGAASIKIPQGTPPAAPSDGDCWMTAATGLACAVNGTAVPAGVPYQDVSTGARVRSITAKLADMTDVQDFNGCDATGVSDSTACFQSALNKYSGGAGGIVRFKGAYRIASNLTIPVGVMLKGSCDMPGTPGNNSSVPYNLYTCGILRLASTASITMMSGSGISSAIIYRYGMSFPSVDSSAYAGTAIVSSADDISISRAMIIGFNKAFNCTACQRPRIDYLYADNINNIEISASLDIPWISHLHAWPFGTIGGTGGTNQNNGRQGDCIYLHDTVDWSHISDSFCYGYLHGLHIKNVNTTSVIGFSTDNLFDTVPILANSVGILIEGFSADTRVVGFQGAAQARAGIEVATDAGVTSLNDTTVFGGSAYGILVSKGDTIINGGLLGTNAPIVNGVVVASSTAQVSINNVRFGNVTGTAVGTTVPTSKVFLNGNDFGSFTGGIANSTMTVQSIASASTLVVPNTGSVFNVTGTTSFGQIANGYAGKCATFVFAGALSVYSSTGSYGAIHLNGGGTFTSVANDTLTACHNGTQWFETGRSH
ncbi:hypothetical protein [Sphingomonas sp. 10B4]|uniref:hypothetical protein n=1 Tax=Sphingomonas sp. 10B4 TaxID=3048575 RepID=UPI002AB5610E|nr:hypothetical protein [Sphingomonas sp. 10B4]MDY7525474.1 hypothetical protein [Sphingomonas sp. 10B4]MEB0281418.1 hypothetical protein [Sphingomonas sp. 10B4]